MGKVVFVVDGDPASRRAIVSRIRPRASEVIECDSGRRLLEHPPPEGASCVVLVASDDEPGPVCEVQRGLLERGWASPVIVVAKRPDIEECVKAMRAGAIEYLAESASRQALSRAIREALAMDDIRRAAHRDAAQARMHLAELSPRERDVLGLLIRGYSSRRIAEMLGRSPSTVNNHRHRVMSKMRAENAAHLAWLATVGSMPPAQATAGEQAQAIAVGESGESA